MTSTRWLGTCSWRRMDWPTAPRPTHWTPARAPPQPRPPRPAWRRWSFSPRTASSRRRCPWVRCPSINLQCWQCSRNHIHPCRRRDTPRWEPRNTTSRTCRIRLWYYRGMYLNLTGLCWGTVGSSPWNRTRIYSPPLRASFQGRARCKNRVWFPRCPGRCRFSGTRKTNAPRPPAGNTGRESGSVSARRSSITATARTVISSMM